VSRGRDAVDLPVSALGGVPRPVGDVAGAGDVVLLHLADQALVGQGADLRGVVDDDVGQFLLRGALLELCLEAVEDGDDRRGDAGLLGERVGELLGGLLLRGSGGSPGPDLQGSFRVLLLGGLSGFATAGSRERDCQESHERCRDSSI
jgi:hypothetical protein